LEDLAA